MEPTEKSFAPVVEHRFTAQSRKQRQEKLDKLAGDLAELKKAYEKEHAEAVEFRKKATKAREDAQKAEDAAVKEEGEEKTALDNYNKKVDEIRGAGGSAQKIEPSAPVPQPKGKH